MKNIWHKLVLLGALWWLAGGLAAQELDLRTPEGQQIFAQAQPDDKAAFFRLIRVHENQTHKSTCGVASSVTALNALGILGQSKGTPTAWRGVTQDTFFTPETEAVRAQALVLEKGFPLMDLVATLNARGARAEGFHLSDTLSLDTFRANVRAALRDTSAIVIVNYSRNVSEGKPGTGGGHFSPLGAYDAQSDSFLIMDVGGVQRGFVWVKAEVLRNALNTIDTDGGKKRGYIVVRK